LRDDLFGSIDKKVIRPAFEAEKHQQPERGLLSNSELADVWTRSVERSVANGRLAPSSPRQVPHAATISCIASSH
jgi:hypothetical protein